jgi:hypothetical protein
MATITPTKTDSIELLAHQAATHPTTIVGTPIDVETKRAVAVHLYHGYVEATADTNFGSFLIQLRYDDHASPGNTENWVTVVDVPAAGTTPDTEAMTATEPAGETTLACASTTGFAVGDLLYIQDTGTLADSEWARCKTFVSNTNIQLIDGLTTQKDSADVIWNDATVRRLVIGVETAKSLRVVWTHEGATGANGHVKAFAVTYDSDTSV